MDRIISQFIVAAAVLFALVGVLWGGWEVEHKSTAGQAASDQGQISQNIQTLYKIGTAGNYSNISNATAINGGAIPQSMLNGDGSTIVGPWPNSRVTISSIDSGTGFQAAWTGVVAKDCATFARSQTAVGGVEVNGTSISLTDVGTDLSSQISNACAAATSSTATVTFLYTD